MAKLAYARIAGPANFSANFRELPTNFPRTSANFRELLREF